MSSKDDARFEAILATCIEQAGQDESWSLDEACARHPEHEERLRASLTRLHTLGLLDAAVPAAVPENVGAYSIVARLGRGGMGVVYLARDPKDGRPVALKMGPAPLEPGDASSARFEREIRAFAGLSHQNLVRILDVGRADGRPFYTMEYVAGATLAEILTHLRAKHADRPAGDVEEARSVVRAGATRAEWGRRTEQQSADSSERGRHHDQGSGDSDAFGRTWVEFACRRVLDAARALVHVHAAGIVHRDVKPANVIVRQDGRALLFDLGLARVDEGPGITRSGDFAGTPHYVSPEVARGDARVADGRSDVFSLGVTLFELLTLRRPFEGDSTARVLAAISDREPPLLRQVDPDLPRDLETICSNALEKDPARRYPSMSEFAADLERFLTFQPVRARPIGAVRRGSRFARRRPALASAIVLGAIVIVGFPAGLLVANRVISGERDNAKAAALEAQNQLQTSSRVVEFLIELFHTRSGRSQDLRAGEMLERGARSAQSEFGDQPLVRAALLEALGRVYANADDRERALNLLDRSLAIRQREVGEDHADTARTLEALGIVHLESGDAASARALFQRSLSAATRARVPQPGLEATVRARLGGVLLQLGDTTGAADQLDLAARAMGWDAEHGLHGGSSPMLALVLERLGQAQLAQGAADTAERSLDGAMQILGQQFVPDLEARARVLELMAGVRLVRGEEAEATALRSQAARLHQDSRARPGDSVAPALAWDLEDGERLLAAFGPPWQREYERAFQAGITALQAGDRDRAVAAFQRCLEWRPRNAVCAYNIACAHTIAGDVDAGLQWIARAIELDAGRSPELAATIERDSDTAPLRADPRGQALLEKLRVSAREQDPAPRSFVPSGPAPAGGWPLVVLLLEGADAEARFGAWVERARTMGLALLAPPPHWRLGRREGDGRSWVAMVPDFAKRPWAYEEPVVTALTTFSEKNSVDPGRVFVAGEGSGALVAFDLAARAPGLVRGALLVEGPVHSALSVESATMAARSGSMVRALVDRSLAEGQALPLFERFLGHCGFGAASARAIEGDSDREARIDAALAELLASSPQQR